MKLFAYGTLMVPQIMEMVTGCVLESFEAVLPGYERYILKGEHYPGLIKKESAITSGVVYANVPKGAVYQLDLFEGHIYQRNAVTVQMPDSGEYFEVMTYLVKNGYLHLLSDSVWDYQQFLRDGKGPFIEKFRGFDDITDE